MSTVNPFPCDSRHAARSTSELLGQIRGVVAGVAAAAVSVPLLSAVYGFTTVALAAVVAVALFTIWVTEREDIPASDRTPFLHPTLIDGVLVPPIK